MSSAEETLALNVAALKWEDVPEAVRHEARRGLMNFFAVAFAGSTQETVHRLGDTLAPFSSGGTSAQIGHASRRDPLLAAYLNAAAANIHDFDDTHIPTIIHPFAPVAPAVLAASEMSGASGQDSLLAIIAGVETTCRLGNALSPSHYARGWHITSTCGVFGAALGTSHLFKMSAEQCAAATGLASGQAAGLVETLGTDAKSLSVGNAARNGLLAALMAQAGLSGPARPLTGERGYSHLVSDVPKADALNSGWGSDWEILNNTYKPYPCGVVLNPVIEACLALTEAHAIPADAVARITLVGHPLLRQRTDRPDVASARLSQVSGQHAVAVALLRQRAGLSEFSDEAVHDPAVRALGSRVRFEDDATFDVESARVTVEMDDGKVLSRTIDPARGSRANPLSDSDLENKLRTLAAHAGFSGDTEQLIDTIWSVDRLDRTDTLMKLAARSPIGIVDPRTIFGGVSHGQ